MKTYRVGIIGLGRMGSTIDDEGHTPLPYSVAAACRASERLEIAAGCDLRTERREDFSRRWGVNALYEDFRDMVREERPDIVAVCTTASGLQKPAREAPDASFRGDSHAELAVALAEMGVPMLYVEKAMASSMAAADDILDAVLKNGTVFNTGVLRRFDNRYGVVRDAVLRGDVGEPTAAVHYARSSLMHGSHPFHRHALLADRRSRHQVRPWRDRPSGLRHRRRSHTPRSDRDVRTGFRERSPRVVDSRGGMGVRDHRDRGDHPVAEQRGRCIVAAGAARGAG